MNEPDLVLVYDFFDDGLQDWWFPAFGLVFVAIGWLMVRYMPRLMSHGRRGFVFWYARIFTWIWFGGAVVFTVVSFGAIIAVFLILRHDYSDGRFEVVEGPVESYRAATAGSDDRESYVVGDWRFSYSDFDAFPGYHKTRRRGSPIDEGVYVRISHVNGAIVRLEVERSAVERAAGRPVDPIQSFLPSTDEIEPVPQDSFIPTLGQYMWAAFPIIMLGYALSWRWRGRVHIARDPSLRSGYNRMTSGLFLWGSAPVFAGVFISAFGNVDLSDAFGTTRPIPLAWLVAYIVLALVIAKWIFWTFYQDGVQKLAEHPGLINSDWVAKLLPLLFAAIYTYMIAQSLKL